MSVERIASRIGAAPDVVRRLEAGDGRIPAQVLSEYCSALGISTLEATHGLVSVPVIGVVKESGLITLHSETMPAEEARAPYIVPSPSRLAAVRWESQGRLSVMTGHLAFFYSDVRGIPDDAWGQRCVVRLTDGRMMMVWPSRDQGRIQIEYFTLWSEWDVSIDWASPVIAVVQPQAL
jgi:hypothetical protein